MSLSLHITSATRTSSCLGPTAGFPCFFHLLVEPQESTGTLPWISWLSCTQSWRCEDNISLQTKMCGWVEGKVAVCKPLGSAVWLAPKGVQRRWCPWLAWWAGDKDNHLERAGGGLRSSCVWRGRHWPALLCHACDVQGSWRSKRPHRVTLPVPKGLEGRFDATFVLDVIRGRFP